MHEKHCIFLPVPCSITYLLQTISTTGWTWAVKEEEEQKLPTLPPTMPLCHSPQELCTSTILLPGRLVNDVFFNLVLVCVGCPSSDHGYSPLWDVWLLVCDLSSFSVWTYPQPSLCSSTILTMA